jgi:aminoglycoside phosphotransferase
MDTEVLQEAPPVLSKIISGYIWQQNQTGLSTSQVFHLKKAGGENLYLKIDSRRESRLLAEKQRLEWLKGKLPVPELRFFVSDDERDYLLISEIEGSGTHADLWKKDIPRTIRQLAAGVKLIHSLPIADCPFDERSETKIKKARRRIELRLIEQSNFEKPDKKPEELFQKVVADKPDSEDLVFTHGDYCLPNVIMCDFVINGFIDLAEAGIADRYQDIALLVRSVEYNFGKRWIPMIFECLGIEPNWEKIEFYQLLDKFF